VPLSVSFTIKSLDFPVSFDDSMFPLLTGVIVDSTEYICRISKESLCLSRYTASQDTGFYFTVFKTRSVLSVGPPMVNFFFVVTRTFKT
jgi:IMP cyclohydrolase